MSTEAILHRTVDKDGLNNGKGLDLDYQPNTAHRQTTDHGGYDEVVINPESSSSQSFCYQTSQNKKDGGDHHGVCGDDDVGAVIKGRDLSMTGRHIAMIVLSRLAV